MAAERGGAGRRGEGDEVGGAAPGSPREALVAAPIFARLRLACMVFACGKI